MPSVSIEVMEELDLYNKFIELGRNLGLSDKALLDFASKKVADAIERQERHLEREAREKERLLEEKEKERDREREREQHQLELARLKPHGPNEVPEGGSNRSLIKLASYRDGDDVEVYLATFEMVRSANKWSDVVAMSALHNGFASSRVISLIVTLPVGITYEEMKKEIVKGFGFTAYDYQNSFRNTKQGKENFRQYILKMSNTFSRWCQVIEVEKSFDGIRELMIKDQIIRAASRELADYLKEKNIFGLPLDEVITLADNFQAIHPHPKYGYAGDKATVSSVSHREHHTDDRKCYNCYSPGHIARNCRKIHNENTRTKPNPEHDVKTKCFNCNQHGHVARNCPERRPATATRQRSVVNHVQRSGPENEEYVANGEIHQINTLQHSNVVVNNSLPVTFGTVNGKEVKILRDTGASVVLMRKSLLNSSDKILDKRIRLKFANNSQVTVATALIRLNCPLYEGEIEVALLDDLPFDVLLGNIPGVKCACDISAGTVEPTACMVQTRGQRRAEGIPESVLGKQSKIKFNLESLTCQELCALQKRDVTLNFAWEKAELAVDSLPRYFIRDGLLLRECYKSQQIRDIVTQIVLPVDLRARVMEVAHDSIWAGHLGTRKTQDRILNHFFWPGIYSDIRRYCQSCNLCQKLDGTKPTRAPLISVPVIGKPFQRVAIDIVGPLSKSRRNNRFVLVAIDLATKYPDAVALKTIDSDRIAEALMEIFSRVGLPTEILHDQGTNFMSKVMAKFNSLLQIKRVSTTPYNPSCNGTCEAFNKVLKKMLRKIANDDPLNWDRYLNPLLFAYREVPQSSTGFSPFELLFGYDVRGPLFLIKENFLNRVEDEEQIPVTEYVMKIRQRLREFLQVANENEVSEKAKQKVYYDRRSRVRKFRVGDKVLLLLPTSSIKLLAEWKGPFEIVKKLNKVDYVVQVEDRQKVYHVNMLKNFRERQYCVNYVSMDGQAEENLLDEIV